MKPGPKSLPHLRLNPAFRALVQQGMRDHRPPGYILVVLSDFRHLASLSKILHGDGVPATPLNVARLEKLAELVGYVGPLFEGEEQEEQR